MKLFYSAETRGFYRDDIHRNSIPADAVKITKADHESLIRGQSEGKRIVTGDDGKPRLADASEDPIDKLAARKRREIESAYNSALAEGLPYTMPDGSDDVIQTRPEDEANLLGLAIEARDLKAEGVTDAAQELRAQSNMLYEMTPEQMIEATDAAKAFKKSLLKRSWELKAQIDAALDDQDRERIEAMEW